ncbi:MAG: GMC family oxidoreductase [Hyphomonadaceae bacterium]|nr:GMC family oxidoreductase [Hyphomonadaceae bacterium]
MTNTSGSDMPEARYDAIIIGSGMGGSAVALRLAQAGRKVAILERGKWFQPDPDASDNPFVFDLQDPEDDFLIVSGRSKFYGSALYRFREIDFEAREFETGTSPAWPISYGDLEPYYAEAERLYRVHGSPEGDPSEPPRASPYPYPPLPHDPMLEKVKTRLGKKGVETAPMPRGVDYGEGGACILCADCSGFYCRLDAKMDAETATLRPALQTGNVELLTETDCARILTDISGKRVEGVLALRGNETLRLKSDRVILAAGYQHTVTLLRRSRNDTHPEGLGNQGGWLGRGVSGHSAGTLFPLVSLLDMGPRHTNTLAIQSWIDGDPDSDWPYPLGVAQMGGQTPFWRLTSALKQPAIRAVAKRALSMFLMTEALPDKETGWRFDGDTLIDFKEPYFQAESYKRLVRKTRDAFQSAGYPVIVPNREVQLWHPTGGAIMGSDPANSVVDGDGQVHGVAGLYVADASVLPSASAVNTGLTIVALALRAADKTLA